MNISLSPSPLMFAARKKADPKNKAQTPPALTGGDTEQNRETAAKFLVQIFPFDKTSVGKELKALKTEIVDFFKEGSDYELSNIQELIRLTQSKKAADQKKALSTLVSIAREMGHGISMDDD
ncbi:MAG: hypothetical protein K2X66_14365 [Cyanobacteria bacterium]|nr:hypothetical protein [Cyanobacteriota bacterium]